MLLVYAFIRMVDSANQVIIERVRWPVQIVFFVRKLLRRFICVSWVVKVYLLVNLPDQERSMILDFLHMGPKLVLLLKRQVTHVTKAFIVAL